MNKDGIRKTARCRFDVKESVYIVESPLSDMVAGVSESADEAWAIFDDLLRETYINYLEGKLVGYDKRGRPSKGRVGHHAELSAETKKTLVALAKRFACSQGEVIDYLVWHHNFATMPGKPVGRKPVEDISYVAEPISKYSVLRKLSGKPKKLSKTPSKSRKI
jgi:3',5'-cyclic AMP phosphodiesterase CpdA